MTTSPESATIGVAVAVPDPWGAELQSYRTALGDHSAAGIPTHVTLLPPQSTDPADRGTIVEHLEEASLAHGPFRIRLRGTGTFRPVSPVVFVAVAEGISGCEELAASVRGGPLHVERQFPYHPHVTVAHDQPDEVLDRAFQELADFRCDFVVDHFSLYVHDGREGWVPTRDFALTAPPLD